MTKISSHQFHKEIQALPPTKRVFSVYPTYILPENRLIRQPENNYGSPRDLLDDEPDDIDLSSVLKSLRHRFRDFFNARNASRLASHKATDHAIELKPRTEPPYMRMYNMSLAELKALDDYINKALAKG